jgi:hypothetical protein
MAGTGGMATAGTGGAGTSGAAGAGTGGSPPIACKTGTAPINGSGLTISATDIGGFKYVPPPSTKMTKMAYDPVGKVVVILTQDGQLFSMDPAAALPTTAQTSPV